MLDKKQLKNLLKYDKYTGKFTYKISSGSVKKGNFAGYINPKGYEVICINKKLYLSHRLAFLYVTGKFPNKLVDHIDHNKLNNKWKNIRGCNLEDNQLNRSLNKNNKSGFNGIEWNKRDSKWSVRINIKGKRKYLGSYKNIKEAIKVRKEANIKYNYHKNHGK